MNGIKCLRLEKFKVLALTHKQSRRETQKDTALAKGFWLTMEGWPEKVNSDDRKLYFCRRRELTVELDSLMLGTRVIVPSRDRKYVLNGLHEGHAGITKVKVLARNYEL